MNLINKAIAAAENDELAADWRQEPAQYAPVIRELVARVAELERQCLHQIQEPKAMTHTSTEQPEALPTPEVVMEQAQVFASAWALYGSGSILEPENSAELAAEAKAELAGMVRRLHSRVQELEASQAQRAPLDAYKLREIFKKLNANHDEEGWNFADLVREVEEYHGITNQKCSGCSGVGLVGGLTHDGYVSDECPFCKGSGIDNGITQEKQG